MSKITGKVNYKEVLKGDTGYTYKPHVTTEGILYWSNNGDLPNPLPVNIKGKDGDIIQNELIESITDINLHEIVDNKIIKLSNINYYVNGNVELNNCEKLVGISLSTIKGKAVITFNKENVIIKNIKFKNTTMLYKYGGNIIFDNCEFEDIEKSCLFIRGGNAEFINCKCKNIGTNLNDDYTYLGGLVYAENCESLNIFNCICKNIHGQACVRFTNLNKINVENSIFNETKYRAIGGSLEYNETIGLIKNNSFLNIGKLNNLDGVGCNAIYTYRGSSKIDILNNVFVNVVENAIEGNYLNIKNNLFDTIGSENYTTPSKECIWGDIEHIEMNHFKNINLYPINKSLGGFTIKTINNNIFEKGDISKTNEAIRCLKFNANTVISNNILIGYDYLLKIENNVLNNSKVFIKNDYNKTLNPKGHYNNVYILKNNLIEYKNDYESFTKINDIKINNANYVSFNDGILKLSHNNTYDSFIYKEFNVKNDNIIMVDCNFRGQNKGGIRIVPYNNERWDYENCSEYYKLSNNEKINLHFVMVLKGKFRVEIIHQNYIEGNEYEISNLEITLKENGGFINE